MQFALLDILKCPVSNTDLKFELIAEFEKEYANQTIKEIKDGLLFSNEGFVFPVIDGIPRLLVESIYDYGDFLKKHLPDYESVKTSLEEKHAGLMQYCIRKNKKTKQSFEFEWSFLDDDKKDKIWRDDEEEMLAIFLKETNEAGFFYNAKKVIDVGSGHGIMTSKIATIAEMAVGIELSKAVENAYKKNLQPNAWYVQADLQFLPFKSEYFDVLYSSGVIHHTNNTELSLSLIEPVLKSSGKLCLWLYHPQKSIVHNIILAIRLFTKILPLQLAFVFLMIFIFPFTFLLKKIKNKKSLSYKEEIIDLLDQFTPEFRYEIPQDLAHTWLSKRNYKDVSVTSTNQFGFSITGIKTTT